MIFGYGFKEIIIFIACCAIVVAAIKYFEFPISPFVWTCIYIVLGAFVAILSIRLLLSM